MVIASLFFAVTTAFTATHIYAQLVHPDQDQNKRFKLLGADPYANLYKRKSPILNKTTLTHFLVGAVAFTLALCLYLFVPPPVFAMMATTAICGSLLPFYIKSFIALLHSSLPLYKLTLKYKLKLRVGVLEKQPDLKLLKIVEESYTDRVESPNRKLSLVTKYRDIPHTETRKQSDKAFFGDREQIQERETLEQAPDDRLAYFTSLGGVFNNHF